MAYGALISAIPEATHVATTPATRHLKTQHNGHAPLATCCRLPPAARSCVASIIAQFSVCGLPALVLPRALHGALSSCFSLLFSRSPLPCLGWRGGMSPLVFRDDRRCRCDNCHARLVCASVCRLLPVMLRPRSSVAAAMTSDMVPSMPNSVRMSCSAS